MSALCTISHIHPAPPEGVGQRARRRLSKAFRASEETIYTGCLIWTSENTPSETV